jgi:hypothetical protein
MSHTSSPKFTESAVSVPAIAEQMKHAASSTEAEVVQHFKTFTPGPSNGSTLSAALDSFISRYSNEPANKVPTPWSVTPISYRHIYDANALEDFTESERLAESEDESDDINEYIEESVAEYSTHLQEDNFKVQTLQPEAMKLTTQDEGEILSFLSDIFGFPSNQSVRDEANFMPAFPPVPTASFAPQSRHRGSYWMNSNDLITEVQHQQGRQTENQSDQCAFSVIKSCSLVATVSDSEPLEKCSICLDSMACGQRVRILSCFHRLHDCCSGRYFRTAGIKPACPVCRHVA